MGQDGRTPAIRRVCERCGGFDAQSRCADCGLPHHDRCLAAGCADPGCASHLDGADTPPLGLPLPVEEPVDAPIIIERGRGWMWAAVAAGTLALAAAAVLLVLLLGGGGEAPATALVPQVTDFEWQQARQLLEDAGFVPVHEGVIRLDGTDGIVFQQDPPANSTAAQGSFVEILYAIVPEATEPAVSPMTAPVVPPGTSPPSEPPTIAAETQSTPSPTSTATATATTAGADGSALGPPLDPPWIAIVATPATEQEARDIFAQRYQADHPRGGVLETSRYPQMRDGFWVVYLDHFATREEAAAFCRDRVPQTPTPSTLPSCYVRTTAV